MSDKEKLAELKVKFEQIMKLIDDLNIEFRKEKYIVTLDGRAVGISEKAFFINKEEKKILDELSQRSLWIQTEMGKISGELNPADKIDKSILEEHDSELYIDLKDSAVAKDFKDKLQEKVNKAGFGLADYLSHMNRSDADDGFTLSTALDIITKLIAIKAPVVAAAIETARFVADVVGKAYKSLQSAPKVNAYDYVTNLQKSLKAFVATDESYYKFATDFAKYTKTPLNNKSSTVNRKVFQEFKDKFLAAFMNEADIKTDLIRYLAQNQKESLRLLPNNLSYSTGTVVVEYNYDKESKSFEFESGFIDNLGSDLKKIIENDKKDDAVVDLPLKILLRVDTNLLGKMVQGTRNDTPGKHDFEFSFYGEEDVSTAKKIIEEFSKSKLLTKLKVSEIL